jgi:hypothetical protein
VVIYLDVWDMNFESLTISNEAIIVDIYFMAYTVEESDDILACAT